MVLVVFVRCFYAVVHIVTVFKGHLQNELLDCISANALSSRREMYL